VEEVRDRNDKVKEDEEVTLSDLLLNRIEQDQVRMRHTVDDNVLAVEDWGNDL
jgi:uncharacterized metal-binding protein YceD (DUF177 family)